MKIGVLSIQGAVSEHLKHLELCGAKAVPVKSKAELSAIKGLVIPGGESTTIGKLIQAAGLDKPIKERAENGSLAVFGTCAGMVVMAGEVTDGLEGQPRLELMDTRVKRNAFGRQRESFEMELDFKSFDRPLTGVFIRSPIITGAGEKVEVLTSLPEGIVAARQDNLLAVSFHPELTGDRRIHYYFLEMCRQL